jgi:spermidine/putrescine transport system substrate-binding protein
MDYIWYGSPISAAREYMDPELAQSTAVYPDQSVLDRGTSFAFLPEDISRYVEGLFMGVRNS